MHRLKTVTKSLTFITSIFTVLFIAVRFSPTVSAAGGLCGNKVCANSEFCEFVCPSPPGVGECVPTCTGSNSNNTPKCPVGTGLVCASPPIGRCTNYMGGCYNTFPSKITGFCSEGYRCQDNCGCCPAGNVYECEAGTYQYTYRYPSKKSPMACKSANDAFVSGTTKSDCRYDKWDELIDCQFTSTCKKCGCVPYVSPDPVGNQETATCDATNATTAGWVCDSSDYSSALTVELYADGKKGAGGVYLGTVVADKPGDATVAAACGGNANHRFSFNYPTQDLYGTHDIYAYAINVGPGANSYLIGSPKSVTCTPPPVQPITGYVWEDTNGNGTADINGRYPDKFWGPQNSTCTTAKSSTMKIVDNTAGVNASFACRPGPPPRIPEYTTAAHVASGALTFTLTPPNNIACTSVVWQASVCNNAACTSANTSSGAGCSATINNTSGLYPNRLNWRVAQQLTRTITGNLYETSDPTTCDSSAAIDATVLGGLDVKAYDSIPVQKGITANVDSGNGSYTITGLNSGDNFSSIYINGSLSTSTKSYQLSCIKATGVTCTKGAGASAVGCISTGSPATPTLAAASPSVSFGFTASPNDKWISVIDGDIYADSIVSSVAPNPLGGFSPYLINTTDAGSIGGFGFAATSIDTQTSGSDVSEKGGSAQNLSILPSYPPSDSWLNKFSFSVPEDAITSVPSDNKFKEGSVYSFSVDEFNQILDVGTYSFEDGNSNAPAAAIVYVTGTGSIDINKNFVSLNTDKILLVVTTAEVNISKDPGTTLAGYSLPGDSQLDIVLISKSDINFASQYNKADSTYDNPLMIYGALMSGSTINPDRNLGDVNNSNYPATSIRFYPYLLHLLGAYELENATTGPYTGLATVDVQFDYGDN